MPTRRTVRQLVASEALPNTVIRPEGGPPSAALCPSGASLEGSLAADNVPFEVPAWLHFLSGFVDRYPRLCVRAAMLETRSISRELSRIGIDMPIYICGLARSGSTLLHEAVAAVPSVATHRMKDFPLLFTPYWWRRATARLAATTPRERAHGDGVMITSESPDALEEMLWMAFFPHSHDPLTNNVLAAGIRRPEFESFYFAHLRKLMLAEHAARYAAKANYHVARLAYLIRLFPNAKFILPVRLPADHVASLMRQQRRFTAAQQKHRRALAFMRRSGHFEFGLDRRPMNFGDSSRVKRIVADWAAGDDVRGFAHYWDMVYAYLAGLLRDNEQVAGAALVVRFEDLCEAPEQTLRAIVRHAALPDAEKVVAHYASRIRRPNYYDRSLTEADLEIVNEVTAATARLWGYH